MSAVGRHWIVERVVQMESAIEIGAMTRTDAYLTAAIESVVMMVVEVPVASASTHTNAWMACVDVLLAFLIFRATKCEQGYASPDRPVSL